MHLYQGGGAPLSNNTIRYNIVHDNGLVAAASAILLGGQNNLVYNNIIYNDGGPGIQVHYTAPQNSMIYNNTIYNVGNSSAAASGGVGTGIYIGPEASGIVVKNNIVNNTPSPAISNNGVGSVVSNNLSSVAGFLDAANANFGLTSGSAAIDAGTFLSVVPDDFNGVRRPQGSAYDIGAYEYGGTSTASTSSTSANLVVSQ